jgi:hypothetical protein
METDESSWEDTRVEGKRQRTDVARIGVDVGDDERRLGCKGVGADTLASARLDLLARWPAVKWSEQEQVRSGSGAEREEIGLEIEACRPNGQSVAVRTRGGVERRGR